MGSQGLSVPSIGADTQRPDPDAGADIGEAGLVPLTVGTAPFDVRAARPRIRTALYPLALVTADGLSMSAAVAVATATEAGLPLTVAAGAAVTGLNAAGGLYRRRLSSSLLDDTPALAARAAAVAALAAALSPSSGAAEALATSPGTLRELIATWFWIVILYALLAGPARAAAATGRRLARRGPGTARPAVIVGTGPTAEHVTGVLRRRREFGLVPVGQILSGSQDDRPLPGLPVLGRPVELRQAVLGLASRTDTDGSTVVIVMDDVRRPDLDTLVRACSVLPCETLLVLSTLDLLTGTGPGSRVEYLAGLPCLRLGSRTGERLARTAKRAFDLAAATAALTLAWPVLLACALAVRLEGGPGVLFRQRRVGAGGRQFVLLKFRSLRPADDHEADTRWSVNGDARMGPVGRFLRETSLDELPQLWNVVRGDMSLVGPRPERPHFVRLFSESCPGYALRHRVPAGMTGWAQVNGLRGDTSIELRAKYDNRYIDTWSFGTDLKILLMTVRAVLTRNDP
ncbi:exopolysaccharide biosynthesis polyprenyl glycosylphosphotransferase [Actinomadura sp. 9N407]|uniref:exopolysaccharide biosynthesis polyprenyl glycosylphosphotransferase n=1 Tax=Actinomadura sp. 9N407 TaxID=3375154 RepID=UPI00378EA4F7